MTHSDPVPSSGVDSKDGQHSSVRSVDKDVSHWARACPSCGAYSAKYMESCVECGIAFEPRKGRDVMVPCPMCNGTGTIFLDYLDEHALSDGNQEDRWLPCSDCDGIGQIPKGMIIDRENKTILRHLVDILSGLFGN